MKQLVLLLAAAAAAAWLFDTLQLPVAWLLGPMVAGIVAAGIHGKPRPLPPASQVIGQAVLGLATGVSFPLATLKSAAVYSVPLFIAVVLTAGLSMLNGHLLWKWAGVDRATGFMGSLPGAASSMVAMSDEMGADAVVVAMLQYVRLLLVSFLAPVAVSTFFPAGAGAAGHAVAAGLPEVPPVLGLVVLVACGAFGAWAGRRLHIPSPTFLGPFFAMLIVAWTVPLHFAVPLWMYRAGMLAVGLSIGVRFDVPTARRLGRMAVIETALVIGLIAIAILIGWGFHAVTGVDTMTAVLGSTPGGMDTMVASALTLGADAGLVLAMQLVRWFVVLLAGPWVTGRLIGKDYARGGIARENGSRPD
ncbi:MAG TPA: AbrB family transcriptional regulator [Symbiobacteriaceae bacterium]|jgi:hypothetical protein